MNLSSAFNRYLATPSVVHMLCEQKISSLLFDFSTIFITKSFSHHVAHCFKIQFLVQKFDFVKTHFFEWFEFSRQKNWKNNLEFSDKKLHFVSVCWVFLLQLTINDSLRSSVRSSQRAKIVITQIEDMRDKFVSATCHVLVPLFIDVIQLYSCTVHILSFSWEKSKWESQRDEASIIG